MAYYFSNSNFYPLSPHPQSPVPSSCSSSDSASASPNIDCEIFPMPNEQSRIKSLLNMFPPPITARQFVQNNSFSGTDGHVKRPSNCFMIFRKIAHDQKNLNPDLKHYNEREFSKIIASMWKELSEVEVSFYRDLSREISDIHKKDFPEYKYKPKRDKAAWKHYNPEEDNKSKKRKPKPKHSAREQKQQEQPKNNDYPCTPPELKTTQVAHEIIPKMNLNLNTQPTILSTTDMEFDFSPDPISPVNSITSMGLNDGLAISALASPITTPSSLDISPDLPPDFSPDFFSDYYYLWSENQNQYLFTK